MNSPHHTRVLRLSRTLPTVLPPELYQVNIVFFKDGESAQDTTFYSTQIENQAVVLFQIKDISQWLHREIWRIGILLTCGVIKSTYDGFNREILSYSKFCRLLFFYAIVLAKDGALVLH